MRPGLVMRLFLHTAAVQKKHAFLTITAIA